MNHQPAIFATIAAFAFLFSPVVAAHPNNDIDHQAGHSTDAKDANCMENSESADMDHGDRGNGNHSEGYAGDHADGGGDHNHDTHECANN